jgi:3-oxoacid CoA-transferase
MIRALTSRVHITAPLVKSRQIKKCILSYLGQNKALQDAYLGGEIALELNPQGSLADRLRAAGAGQPGFYTRTGAGTFIETGGIPQLLSKKDGNKEQTVLVPGNKKQVAEYDGKKYLFEPAIHGDVAILRAWKVDKAGNCVFRQASCNLPHTCSLLTRYTSLDTPPELSEH